MSPPLSTGFIARVQTLKEALDEVYPKSFDDWIEGFEFDGNPENELLLWECMALTYRNFTDGRSFSREAKEAVLQITLQCSLGRTEKHILSKEHKTLQKVEILGLVDCYRAAAEAIFTINQGRQVK